MPKQRIILWSAAAGEGCFWLLFAHVLAVWLGLPGRSDPWLPLLYAGLPVVLLELRQWQSSHGGDDQARTLLINLAALVTAAAGLMLAAKSGFLALLPYLAGLYQAIRRSNLLEQITADGLHANWRWQLPFLFMGLLFLPGHPQTLILTSVYFLAWVSLTLVRTTSSWRLAMAAWFLMLLVLGLSAISLQHSQLLLWPFRLLYYLFCQILFIVVWPLAMLLDPVVRWLASKITRQQPPQQPPATFVRAEQIWPEAVEWAVRQRPAWTALLVLAGAGILAVIVWWLWRSIQAREEQSAGETIERESLAGWRDLFRRAGQQAADSPEAVHALQRLYRQLQRYGAQLGRPRLSHVTPQVYQQQLTAQQPEASEALKTITDLYMAWRYGDQQPHEQALDKATEAAQRLAQREQASGRHPGSTQEAGRH